MQRVRHGAWLRNNTEAIFSLQMPYAQEDRVPSCSESFATQHSFVHSFIHSLILSFILQIANVSGSERSGTPRAQEAETPSPPV